MIDASERTRANGPQDGTSENGDSREDREADVPAIRRTLDLWRQELLSQRIGGNSATPGYWKGQLSPSALSTATAVSALASVLLESPGMVDAAEDKVRRLMSRGMVFLAQSQNADGGFGDTDRSRSNIATTLLVLAAYRLGLRVGVEGGGCDAAHADGVGFSESQIAKAETYVSQAGGWEGLRRRYGKDKTFVVPILANCAIAGMVEWKQVAPLPFEAAVFPQSMYRFLRMPVVSYAIPALVAIGQARFFRGPLPLPPLRWIRFAAVGRTMKVLNAMQPESGGYLEATPLTSFVLMSLAATGRGDSEVAKSCIRFLLDSALEDGSWPIDTNLATFVTSLAVHALHADPDDDAHWMSEDLIDWHLGCQYQSRHPYTGADPGGWGWTDLSGAVPDGDDTPGAILALLSCRRARLNAGGETDPVLPRLEQASERGCRWLLNLQNGNGGWPTFCRGWGKLPFDRSSVDLTAHAMRALHRHREEVGSTPFDRPLQRALDRGWRFLARSQRGDGSWLPLWFGNHDLPAEENPFYGTGRVLLVYGDCGEGPSTMITRACRYLLHRQNADGGWGGGPTVTDWLDRQGLPSEDQEKSVKITSSVEETAVVLEGLAAIYGQEGDLGGAAPLRASILAGVRFLDQAIRNDRHRTPWPIGFYFAKLWYHEQLYPAVFATAALGRVLKSLNSRDTGGDRASFRE